MNAFLKRLFDISLACLGLFIAAPLMGIISLAIWLESPGNVIFAQERVGHNGKPFKMFKFRKFPTFWKDDGPGVTLKGDARMTRVGAFLERTKLDELPQIWNILKGEMSFVGPRPENTRYRDLFRGKYEKVLNFMPGIFGPCQVAFRNESELFPHDEDPEEFYRRVLFPDKAQRDIAYFQNSNCLTDIFWMFKGTWVSLIGTINWTRFRKHYIKIIIIDALLVAISWTIANLLRFAGLPSGEDGEIFMKGLWMLPPILITGMLIGGCYRSSVSNFCLSDLLRLTAVIPIIWMFCILMLLAFVDRNISFYLLPLNGFVLLTVLILPRILFRIIWNTGRSSNSEQLKKILIYGTGGIGISIINLIKDGLNGVVSLGFLDDDPDLKGRHVNGYKVLGHESDIPTINEVHDIDEIWLSFLPDGLKRNRLIKICMQFNIKLVPLMETEPFLRFISDIREHKRCSLGVNLTCVILNEEKKYAGKVKNVGLGGIEAELKQSFFTENNINIHLNLLPSRQYKQARLVQL
jgi:lipopolysaccharide/colanic/teichoic acid biosynthesis glycosyltransferase